MGPGPWQIMRPGELARGYVTTPDADPRHVYDTVLVALDADRQLNNGEPSSLAHWLDCLDLAPGERFLHVGCGVGYYTAIVAEAVGPQGSVVGVEIEPALAERARRNLDCWPNATVVSGDGTTLPAERFDAIFVNAGVTELPRVWLDSMASGARLLLALTVGVPDRELGVGYMLLVTRSRGACAARFVSPVGVFHCSGARTKDGDDLLRRAYERGGHDSVRSLRLDAHEPDADCWLHAPRFCLSRAAPNE